MAPVLRVRWKIHSSPVLRRLWRRPEPLSKNQAFRQSPIREALYHLFPQSMLPEHPATDPTARIFRFHFPRISLVPNPSAKIRNERYLGDGTSRRHLRTAHPKLKTRSLFLLRDLTTRPWVWIVPVGAGAPILPHERRVPLLRKVPLRPSLLTL
jgi:hypothetical protein